MLHLNYVFVFQYYCQHQPFTIICAGYILSVVYIQLITFVYMKHYFSINYCVPQSIPVYQLSTLSCYELCTVISTWFLHFLHFILYRNVPKFCVCVASVELLISCLLFFYVCVRIYFLCLFLLSPLCFFFKF